MQPCTLLNRPYNDLDKLPPEGRETSPHLYLLCHGFNETQQHGEVAHRVRPAAERREERIRKQHVPHVTMKCALAATVAQWSKGKMKAIWHLNDKALICGDTRVRPRPKRGDGISMPREFARCCLA
ncbi:hypothetical protein SKAU_G00349320 [Synaphobranchus kaupii]|uniref:Uncharacterized protein n=1 Tax=Synaphobranchus kaupii TaxID=118154 RepID=A0A9Q1EK83_SYNKA|nr:hypothetical protein SKAU_G00349320 [Synaphobranchus kaupii]